jgi:sodium transport system permease protein
MTTPSEPRTPSLYHAGRDSAFTPLGAMWIMLASLTTVILVGNIALASGAPLMALALLAQASLLLVPVAALVKTGRGLAALGVRRPAGIYIVAAILIGFAGWYLNLQLVELVNIPEGKNDTLHQMVEGPSVALAVIAIGVVPAICEELLFRGVLFRALASRFIPLVAIVISSVVFAAYHMALVQLLPTFILGLVVATLTYRARSIIPGMIVHLLNNTIVVLYMRDQLPGLTRLFSPDSGVGLLVATVTTVAGLALVARGKA